MASTWVYLIRHGEVEHAAEGRFFGHTDVALSATGLRQVEALARQLALEPIEAVYVFPLEEGAAVCGFEAIIGSVHVVGEVKEREKAFAETLDVLTKIYAKYA